MKLEQKELWEKWIAALESGHYQRTSAVLARSDKDMCCLGVLCDVYDPTRWTMNRSGELVYASKNFEEHVRSVLPDDLTDLLNIYHYGFFIQGDLLLKLTDINDRSPHGDYRDVLPHIKSEFQARLGTK